jgi:hypothetical protein
VNPSTVTLALVMAACVAAVSLDGITTEKEIESVVTCRRWRPAFNTVMDTVGGLVDDSELSLYPNGTKLL